MLSNQWTKASASAANGDCIELKLRASGHVAIRDSKDPEGPRLEISQGALDSFVQAVKAGEFDL